MRSLAGWFVIAGSLVLVDCGGAASSDHGAASGAGGKGTAGATNHSTGGTTNHPNGGTTSHPNGGGSAVSCSPGSERCNCYGNATCNSGLTCASGLCVKLTTVATGGAATSVANASGGAGATGGAATSVARANGGAFSGSGGNLARGGSGGDSSPIPSAGRLAFGGAAAAGRLGFGGATGGVSSFAGGGSHATGGAVACQGIPPAGGSISGCNGISILAERVPVDLILLVDRSVSNSYAFGSDAATITSGQTTRWQVLTRALQALAVEPGVADLGASITFFSIDGSTSDLANCDAHQYATPVVPLGPLRLTGAPIAAAMNAIIPMGLSPTVPALTGTYEYAVSATLADPGREKVVVLISDGFATQCASKQPQDAFDVIQTAAKAVTPIKTFIIGFGSPMTLEGGKYNLTNYAVAGNTGEPPYRLDETAGADAFERQLVQALISIAHSSTRCEYAVEPPTPDWVIDPQEVALTYQPTGGALLQIPRVANADACARSPNGGWYFDVPTNPTKITACPCTCAGFGAGQVSIEYGCGVPIYVE